MTRKSYQDFEIDFKSVVTWTCLLVGAIAVTLAISGLIHREWSGTRELKLQEQARNVAGVFPEPRLQIDETQDRDALRAEESERLERYAWVDRRKGVVRIPIDRAMDLIAGGQSR